MKQLYITLTSILLSATATAQIQSVPGRVQVEDYKSGLQGQSYSDQEAANLGGAYRQDGVDVYKTTDGHAVGWVRPGEWLTFDINVVRSQHYKVYIQGGAPHNASYVRLELDDNNLGASVMVPVVKDFRQYGQVLVGQFYLEAGRHTLSLEFEKAGSSGYVGDFDYILFEGLGDQSDREKAAQKVSVFYQEVLGRQPSSAESGAMVERVLAQDSDLMIRTDLANSAESKNNIISIFKKYLKRDPSAVEVDQKVQQLIQGKTLQFIDQEVANSDEAKQVAAPKPGSKITHIHPMRTLIWKEAGAATTNYGINMPVIMALRGKASGAYNYKIIHPWYVPYKTAMNESQIRNFVQSAKKEGYYGVGLDHEGWTLKSPEILRWMFEEAERSGMKFINVPKITLDHHVRAWKMSEAQVVQIFEKYTHASAGWIYSFRGEHYENQIKKWRDMGYTKQIWGMGDEGSRPKVAGITPAVVVSTIEYMASRQLHFSLFNPKDPNSLPIKALRKHYLGQPIK